MIRFTTIIRRNLAWLLGTLALVSIQVQSGCAEDDVPLTLRNDSPDDVTLYIASEKNSGESPWAQQNIVAGNSSQIILHSPDRFFIVLQIGDHRSKSKPLELKKFLTAHPNYSLKVSEIREKTFGTQIGGDPPPDLVETVVNVVPDAAADNSQASSTNSAAREPLPVEFDYYESDDQSIWSLTPDSATLKLHNDLSDPVTVYIASQKNQNPNPWAKLQIDPDATTAIILKSPDPFLIRIDLGSESARSKPVELKKFLAEHRSYVMNIGRDYGMMIAGGPQSGGGENAPPKLSATIKPDPKKQQPSTSSLTPDKGPDCSISSGRTTSRSCINLVVAELKLCQSGNDSGR